jgi:signal transduction histidine kinase
MSLAKEIVELQGGRVETESQPDRGTTVTLWLPLVQRADHAVQRALELSQPQAV